MTDIRPLTAADLPRAAETLTLAFRHDPLWSWVFPDPRRRAAGCRRIFSFYLRLGLELGAVDVAPGLAGVAMWLHRGVRHSAFTPGLLLTALALPFRFAPTSLRRMIAAEAANASQHRRVISDRHEYLAELAVAPDHRRKGIGTALVRHGLARATGLPCYVETQSAGNLRFYQRLGFELKSRAAIHGSGVAIWSLLRSPDNATPPTDA